jgi:hypothetical protein
MKISNFLLSALMVIAVIVSNSASAQTQSYPMITVIAQQCDEVWVTHYNGTSYGYWQNYCTDVWGWVDENDNIVPPPPPPEGGGERDMGTKPLIFSDLIKVGGPFCKKDDEVCGHGGWLSRMLVQCATYGPGPQGGCNSAVGVESQANDCRNTKPC